MHDCRGHRLQSFSLSECYAGLKERALRGEELTAEELAFVGLCESRKPPAGGWQQPDAYTSPYDLADPFADPGELSPEDRSTLQALIGAPRADQLEFLA